MGAEVELGVQPGGRLVGDEPQRVARVGDLGGRQPHGVSGRVGVPEAGHRRRGDLDSARACGPGSDARPGAAEATEYSDATAMDLLKREGVRVWEEFVARLPERRSQSSYSGASPNP